MALAYVVMVRYLSNSQSLKSFNGLEVYCNGPGKSTLLILRRF